MRLRLWAPAAIALLAFSPLQSFALPGEANAVIKHCGTPSGDWKATSEVTGTIQRNLTYGNTILRFNAATGGWSYASAWHNDHPESLKTVEAALPCVGDALREVAKNPTAMVDPTLAVDHSMAGPQGLQFGKPFLWIMAAIGLVILLSLSLPAARRRVVARPTVGDRPFRRPIVRGFRFAKRSKRTNGTQDL
jgi:hypothetical protein